MKNPKRAIKVVIYQIIVSESMLRLSSLLTGGTGDSSMVSDILIKDVLFPLEILIISFDSSEMYNFLLLYMKWIFLFHRANLTNPQHSPLSAEISIISLSKVPLRLSRITSPRANFGSSRRQNKMKWITVIIFNICVGANKIKKKRREKKVLKIQSIRFSFTFFKFIDSLRLRVKFCV